MKFNKLIVLVLLCFSLTNVLSAITQTSNEIYELKKKIVKMQAVDSESSSINERYYKHQLAVAQVKALKKVAAYETYVYLARAGTKRSVTEIGQITDVAWECSWIFTDLGSTQMERFRRIMEWCMNETNFKARCVSRWKKGQYIKSLRTTIKKDTADYGAWQINEDNLGYAQDIYRLYRSGVISFKIIRPKQMTDLFDIPTNCVVRCAIETDRRAMGMEWKHPRSSDKLYPAYLSKKIRDLQKDGMFDDALVAKYYRLVPGKTYRVR